MPDIDDAIRKAMEEGKFDNLPGQGKPLRLDENPHEDPAWRTAHHLLRNSGFSLPWIALRHEIETETETARQALRRAWDWRNAALERGQTSPAVAAEWQRALEAFRQQAGRINRKISDYNLQIPSIQFELPRLDAEGEIQGLP